MVSMGRFTDDLNAPPPPNPQTLRPYLPGLLEIHLKACLTRGSGTNSAPSLVVKRIMIWKVRGLW